MNINIKETRELKSGDIIFAKYVGMSYSRFKVVSEPEQELTGKLTFEASNSLGIHEISFGTQDQHIVLAETEDNDQPVRRGILYDIAEGWLDSLEEFAELEDEDDPDTHLTQFERNMLRTLKDHLS